jgi:ATP-dependent Lon protease
VVEGKDRRSNLSIFSRTDEGKKGPRVHILPLLPLRDIIVFPHMVVPLFVGRERSIAALEDAMGKDKVVVLAAQKKAKTNEPAFEDLFPVGTLATIIQLLKLPDGTVKALVEGKRRVRLDALVSQDKFYEVRVEELDEEAERNVELEALLRQVQTTFLRRCSPPSPPSTTRGGWPTPSWPTSPSSSRTSR